MRIDNVARFLIRDGCEIVVDRRVDRSRDRQTGAPLSDVRLFLLGSAFGALLHQRGYLPLHVSAVVASDNVWAFTGESGAGKSTIAGWLHYKKGWRMISDDVSVICPSHNEPLLYPGPRKLKLWEDAVSLLDLKGEKLVQDLTNTPKYQLYLSDTASFAPKSLRYLVLLERDEAAQGAALTRLTGVEAFNACMAAVYRPYMAEWFRPGGEVMRNLLSLCEKISVFRYRRSWSLDLMCSEIEMISDRIARDSEVSE